MTSFLLTGRRLISPIMPVSKTRKKKNSGPTQSATPKKETHAESPTWYVWSMVGLMALGTVTVVSAYLFSLGNITLVVGLILIAIGFLMTMNWH